MEKDIRQDGRSMEFGFDEGCKLIVDRTPGANGCDCILQATTATAALKGISLLIVKMAEATGRSVDEILCRLAVVLLVPDEMPAGEDGGDYGGEEG